MRKKFTKILRFWLWSLCLIINIPLLYSKDKEIDISNLQSTTILDSLVNYYKISNPSLSNHYAYQALSLAKKSRSPEQLIFAYKLLGVSCFQSYQDSSFYFYSLANKIADSTRLQKLKIIILYNLAALHNHSAYYTKALVLLDSSIQLARQFDDFVGISNGYNMLGLIKINTHDFDNAHKYFLNALTIAREHNLYEQIGVSLSNLSRSEFEPEPEKALKVQREALEYLKKVRGTEKEMANIMINIGNRCKNQDSALFYYKNALSLAEHANLPLIIVGAYNNMAYVYLDKKDIQEAESCIRDKALPVALKGSFHDWLSSLYDTYADVCVEKGDLKMALAMQKKALKERITDDRLKASEQVRLVSAQLDLQNKELTIQAEEKKILLQQNQLQKTELILAFFALLAVMAIFTVFFLQHRSKVRFAQEKIESARRIIEMEESEKTRTARELHDLTGQLVLGISGMIENIDFPEPELKNEINQHIKELGASIRQISHRMNRAMLEHFTFSEMVEGLCKDYQKLVGLNIKLTLADQIPELSNDIVLHFYRILQELLTNAGKYARGSNILIRVQPYASGISLLYEDDGPGFPPEKLNLTSMGLMNIQERTKLVNGTSNLTSQPGSGVKWEIFFPVNDLKAQN